MSLFSFQGSNGSFLLSSEENERALHLFEQQKANYLQACQKVEERSLSYLKNLKKENELKGGLMVLFGGLISAGGIASFWASEFCYEAYNKAESTDEAVFYRKATQATDFLKLIFMVSGATLSLASLSYFLKEPTESDLVFRENFSKKIREELFVR